MLLGFFVPRAYLLIHGQPVHQDHYVLFCKATLLLIGLYRMLVHGVILIQGHFVELHNVLVSLFLQPVEIPPHDNTNLLSYQSLFPALL